MSQIKVNSIVPAGGLPSGATAGGIIQVVQSVKTDDFSTAVVIPFGGFPGAKAFN